MRDYISAPCSDGKHARCTGWMVVPDFHSRGVAGPDVSIACKCSTCQHPPVPVDRHLHEAPQKGASYGVH